VHLGIVVFAGFKQRDEAIKYFRKALEIQADIKLDKILATPEVQEVYDEAVASRSEETEPPEAAGRGDRARARHESPQGAPITIKATVDPGVGAKKVVLSFSADGADDFAEKEMKEDPPGSGTYDRRDSRVGDAGRRRRLLHRGAGRQRQPSRPRARRTRR
jgi:hypothetical protein